LQTIERQDRKRRRKEQIRADATDAQQQHSDESQHLGRVIDWVLCTRCDRWFHCSCMSTPFEQQFAPEQVTWHGDVTTDRRSTEEVARVVVDV